MSEVRRGELRVIYQLHLMLDAEELMLRVDAGIGAIRELSDELEARDEGLVILGDLIGEEALVVRGREWEDTLVLGRGSTCVVNGALEVVGDGDLARGVAAVEASRASVACELR